MKNKIIIRLFAILALVSNQLIMNAQENELAVKLRLGHNVAFGGFAAVSAETSQTFCDDFSISGGIQYNTIGKTALDARPAYNFRFGWGRVSVEALLEYYNLSSINNFAAGAGASMDSRWIGAKLGYYYRLFGGLGGLIKEPFNIYYELRAHFLKKCKTWDLDFVITNCETFDLERHYQPSFIAEGCYFPKSKFGISFGLGCKPAGMFHISADYYQSYLKAGVCYRW